MFEAVAFLVRRMLIRELPVRGGITLDEHVQFRLTMPSAAIVGAYELEQSAVYPRVRLSSGIVDYVLSRTRGDLSMDLAQYVTFDEGGGAFLNHLIWDEDDDLHFASQFLKLERTVLRRFLKRDDVPESVRLKYSWLASFHDWAVRATNWVETEDDILMEKELLVHGGGPGHRFISLWHILAMVARGESAHLDMNWQSFLDVSAWPYNGNEVTSPFYPYGTTEFSSRGQLVAV